jgi:hypothetical protein
MDRSIVYPGAIPLDTDLLGTNRNAMVALGMLMQATLGTGTVFDGLACTPTGPASMVVDVGPGSVFSLQVVDANAYGSLAADTTDPLVKCGINLTSTAFTLTAPTTSGYSTNFLIEGSFEETDGSAVVLPYYNSSNPSQPYSGPSNSGTPQNTLRTQRVGLQLKAGTPATAGTQTTPAVDSGWTALYVITVNYGQTTVTSGAISTVPTAPFIAFKLPNLRPGFASIQVFSSSGTFTVPDGVTALEVELWGAGGGSGGTTGSDSAGGGGGGGGYTRHVITGLTAGAAISVTIGAGGTAGGAGASGGNGGTTSFGSYCSASGGGGGVGAGAGVVGAGGNGGAGSGGDLNIDGIPGGQGFSLGGGAWFSGLGGATFGTAPAGPGVASTSEVGGAGNFPGGGAAGSLLGAVGGTGAAGLAIVRF